MEQNNNFQKSNNDLAQDFTGAIINTQVNNLNFHDELLTFKKEYNERSKDSEEYEIKIYFDGWNILEKELFKQIEEVVYSSGKYKLKFDYNNCDSREKYSIYKNVEKYIYEQLRGYIEYQFEKINYHKYHNFIIELVGESIQKELDSKERDKNKNSIYYSEGKIIPFLKNFFDKEILPFDKYSNKSFFNSLNENNIEYITKEFQPKTIKEFFENNPHCVSYGDFMEIDLLYEMIKDYDYRIFGEFVEGWHPFDINIGGLKEFLKWANYSSIMYKEVDGMNPWCLYNMCELKSSNSNNCRFWDEFFSQEDIEKEKNLIEEQFEKHMQQFRD